MKMRYALAVIIPALAAGAQPAAAAGPATNATADLSRVPQIHETPAERDARMQWFRDAKFGMFLHWGPVSIRGKELSWSRYANRPWDINGKMLPCEPDWEYDHLYEKFNPDKFNAEQWVKIAQDAGMKYMVLTTKHHDGFCMYDTRMTNFNIMASPYGKDIVKMFADACHKAEMRLGFYYSTRDWHNENYLVGDNTVYDRWYRAQVEELLTNYGKVDVLWFDHVGGRNWALWRFDELFSMMYRHQPDLLVNDRAAKFCGPRTPEDKGPPSPEIRKMTEGDFGTREQSIGVMELGSDWEACMTLVGGQWSWKPNGRMYSLEDTVKMLINCVTGGGNLLLNVGPMPTGEIEQRQVDLLKQVGDWIKPRAVAIYGTRGGPFASGNWGGASHRGNTVYVFVREWKDNTVTLGPLAQKIMAAKKLTDGSEVTVKQTDHGVDLTLPSDKLDQFYTVLALNLERPVEDGTVIKALPPTSPQPGK